jgi:hypothetical protein
MTSTWLGKPCARCAGKKGEKYKSKKYCGRCVIRARRERSKGAHARAIKSRYGITAVDYNTMYEIQGGRCAICQRATGATRRLSVDHDHVTLEVRGLLCRPCNTLLGHARDQVEFFERCIAYLQDPPWRQLAAS